MEDTAATALASSVASLTLSVNDLRRSAEVGFTRVEGELRLLNEKVLNAEKRYDDAKDMHSKQDIRIKAIETDYVTRKSVYAMLTLIVLAMGVAVAITTIFVH